MNSYLKGKIRHLFNPAVSGLALIDDISEVDKQAKVYRFSRVIQSSVGRYSYIGINSWVINAEIGQFCSIATDVYIGLAEHTLDYLSTSPVFTEANNATGHSFCQKNIVNPIANKTVIGNDVWIGYRALIKSGIHIGNGAVIGAGAVVTKDIPPYAIVAGVPAKIIRFRFPKVIIDHLEKSNWWNQDDLTIMNNLKSFQKPLSLHIGDIQDMAEGGGRERRAA